MRNASKFLLILGFLVLAAPPSAKAYQEEMRTANRTATGEHIYPEWVLELPEHYEFLPYTSNHDPQNDHPQQWQGQDWDPSMWNAQWTPETAVHKFYQARIFTRQYMTRGKNGLPVLELGPTFFKISDLDQRRTLKLLVDDSGVLADGFDVVVLKDWYTKDVVGSYTARGMQLN